MSSPGLTSFCRRNCAKRQQLSYVSFHVYVTARSEGEVRYQRHCSFDSSLARCSKSYQSDRRFSWAVQIVCEHYNGWHRLHSCRKLLTSLHSYRSALSPLKNVRKVFSDMVLCVKVRRRRRRSCDPSNCSYHQHQQSCTARAQVRYLPNAILASLRNAQWKRRTELEDNSGWMERRTHLPSSQIIPHAEEERCRALCEPPSKQHQAAIDSGSAVANGTRTRSVRRCLEASEAPGKAWRGSWGLRP